MTSGKGKEAVSGVAVMEGSTVPGTQSFKYFLFYSFFYNVYLE